MLGLGLGSLTVLCAVVIGVRGVRSPRLRLGWSALALGLAVGGVEQLAGWPGAAGGRAPGPGLPVPLTADVLHVLSWLGLLVGLLLVLRPHLRGLPASAWADGVVTGSSVIVVLLSTTFGVLLTAVAGTPVRTYELPGLDLALIGLTIAGVTMAGYGFDLRTYALTTGLLLWAGGHLAGDLMAASRSAPASPVIAAVAAVACLLLAVSSWLPERPRSIEKIIRWPAVLPAAAVLGGASVLWLAVGSRSPALGIAVGAMALVGFVARIAIVLSDVSALGECWRQAHTDELTDLPNRRALLAVLHEAPPEQPLGLMLVNLSRFKEVNDSLGHTVADELLAMVADRLRDAVGSQHLLVRLGGDEFAVLLSAWEPPALTRIRRLIRDRHGERPGRSRPADADVSLRTAFGVAESILAALDAPFPLDGVSLHVQASIGIAMMPDHAEEPFQLLQRAGVAMLTARNGGDGAVDVYRPQDDPHSRERLELIEELIEALRSGALTCHFQPKVHLANGEVHSVEALVRWHHPTRGQVSPETLVALAEHAGLMRQLTDTVLGHALSQAQAWRSAGMDIPVAINLSPTSLLDAALPEQIGRGLIAYGLPPSALQVEITETVMMTDSPRARQTLTRLHDLGISTSIDDYGTGYSSLAYLHELDADELKLDRLFVSRLTSDAGAAAIVRSTIDLAHSLGLRLVAEGVEDEETALALRRYGCDLSQGYHHCRPLPGPDVTAWLSGRTTSQIESS